ncbi:DUF2461 family protein [Actinomadura sp. LD22]|uniref:DUF2461 family protein n=1 Tax=Actinomadura physcomitrii TaxID=2650748 RepID=A0A6I4M217_9ACTN|nr:DUF2461 family protein [Actinomadura physcomitrii]
MTFTGFTSEAFEFYEGLLADNSKSYWTAHRQVYDEHVRGPMADLCAELEEEFGAVKLFRPYRDVRFSFLLTEEPQPFRAGRNRFRRLRRPGRLVHRPRAQRDGQGPAVLDLRRPQGPRARRAGGAARHQTCRRRLHHTAGQPAGREPQR